MKLRVLTILAIGLFYANLSAAQTTDAAPVPAQQPAAIVTHPTPKITTTNSTAITEQQKDV